MRLIDGVRSVFFNIMFFGFTILYLGLIVAPSSFINKKLFHVLLHGYCVGSLQIGRWVMGIKYEYRGTENLPATGALIIVCTHQSNMDSLLVYPRRNDVTALVKKELMSVPFVGTVLKAMNCIPIDRKSAKAHKGMDAVTDKVIAAQAPLLIFPQATRVLIGDTKRLKPGAFYMQETSDLTVIPIATNTGLFWRKGFFHRSGTAVYEIGEPIAKGLDKKAFMDKVHHHVVDRSHALIRDAGYGDELPSREAVRKAARAK